MSRPQTFEIGEVVVVPNWGIEATILSPLMRLVVPDASMVLHTYMAHQIAPADGRVNSLGTDDWFATPEMLRKKPPVRDGLEVLQWADVPCQAQIRRGRHSL